MTGLVSPRQVAKVTASSAAIDEAYLEDRLTALEAARAWSPRVVSRLEVLIRSPDESDLFRVNPIKVAHERISTKAKPSTCFSMRRPPASSPWIGWCFARCVPQLSKVLEVFERSMPTTITATSARAIMMQRSTTTS